MIRYSYTVPETNAEIAVVEVGAGEFARPSYDRDDGRWLSNPTSREEEPASWAGGTRADAERLLEQGNADGAQRVSDLAKEVRVAMPPPRSIRRKRRWADQGDDLDMERVYRGDVDIAWRRTERREVAEAGGIITLLVQFGGIAKFHADALAWSGAAGLAVADLLEEAGYRVQVIGVDFSRHPQIEGAVTILSVPLKEAHQPMQVDTLASIVSSSCVFRQLGLPWIAASHGPVSTGYNASTPFAEVGPGLQRLTRSEIFPDAHVVPVARSRDQAIAAVRDAIQTITGESL